MSEKLVSILRDIENVKIFNNESYLSTSYFVIFLLFGCNDEQQAMLSAKANRLISDKKAYALIDAADGAEVTASVNAAIEKVSKERIVADTLNEIHICPVIISENAEPSAYCGVITLVGQHLGKRDVQVVWKAFLLLDALSPNAAAWLDTVSEGIQITENMRSHNYSCRCCILTRKDENGFSVAEERLLTTVLFVAFLHVVRQTREEVGRDIGYQNDKPEELFYTAQTAFVENPVITRIFNRMYVLLERLRKHTTGAKDIDMSFINDILKEAIDKMPREDKAISLLPLYSVMPEDNIGAFRKRLKDFAIKYYLAFAQEGREKSVTFGKIASGFLQACVKQGMGIDNLLALAGNSEALDRLCTVPIQGISVHKLPPYPGKGRHSQDISAVYDNCAGWVNKQITNMGADLLREYFHSEEFSALPQKYQRVQDCLNEELEEMKGILRQCSERDIVLELLNDPDEKWLEKEYEEIAGKIALYFPKLALAETDEDFTLELAMLLDALYKASKGFSGGSGEYMSMVSETCSDADSVIAKACVTKIGSSLGFPIRVSGSFGKETSCTYVWGSEENNLYTVWEKRHTIIKTRSVTLPLKSNERFAFLRVSTSFSRSQILGISGGDET